MKWRTKRKGIILWLIIIASFAILYIVPVLAQGVSLRYWVKLGFPNPIKVLEYRIDEYPGHSLECMRFPEQLMKDMKGKRALEYSEKGTGIDMKGYHLHIGDSRGHVMDEFFYSDPEGKGTEYELGCFYCEPEKFLTFHFTYDKNNILINMIITKGMM